MAQTAAWESIHFTEIVGVFLPCRAPDEVKTFGKFGEESQGLRQRHKGTRRYLRGAQACGLSLSESLIKCMPEATLATRLWRCSAWRLAHDALGCAIEFAVGHYARQQDLLASRANH